MGSLKKEMKASGNSCSKQVVRKVNDIVKNKQDNTLRLTEVSEEELKRLRIDVYPYLM